MDENQSEFERAGGDATDQGLVAEYWVFLKETRKWWMAPVIVTLLLLAMLLLLTSSAAAPFVYTLF